MVRVGDLADNDLCLRKNAEAGRYDLVSSLVKQINVYVGALASEHEVKSAFEVIESLTASCSDLIFSPKPQGSKLEPIEELALAVLHCINTNHYCSCLC